MIVAEYDSVTSPEPPRASDVNICWKESGNCEVKLANHVSLPSAETPSSDHVTDDVGSTGGSFKKLKGEAASGRLDVQFSPSSGWDEAQPPEE